MLPSEAYGILLQPWRRATTTGEPICWSCAFTLSGELLFSPFSPVPIWAKWCCVFPSPAASESPPTRRSFGSPAHPTRSAPPIVARVMIPSFMILPLLLELHEVVGGEHVADDALELVAVLREIRDDGIGHDRGNGREVVDDVAARHRPVPDTVDRALRDRRILRDGLAERRDVGDRDLVAPGEV